MIDAVGTLSVSNASARVSPHAAAAVSAVAASSAVSQVGPLVSGRIRVDNLQNVAILEYRSQEGEVVRQYPNQSQIEAFREAERIRQKAVHKPAPAAPQSAPQETSAPSTGPSSGSSPAPQTTQSAAPAPSTAPAPSSSSGGSGTSTQSIVV